VEPCPRCEELSSATDPENGRWWCFRCSVFFRTVPESCAGDSRLYRFTNTRAPYSVRKH
jgi:hypothetical protein